MTAAMLVEVGWFPRKNKALKRLKRLVQRRRIKLVGTVCRKGGRPEHVYCRWRPQALLHEVELTEICFRLHAASILRCPALRDNDIRPDAEVWINGECYYLELDRGTESYAQIVRHRFARYERCSVLTLWVCSTEARCEELRKRADRIRHVALFATLADVMRSPHEAIWRDYQGEFAALPRETQAGEKGE